MGDNSFYEDTQVQPEQVGSLGHRAAKGVTWLSAMRVLHRGLGLIRNVILARLLSPDDFGLMGIALLTFNAIETFSQTGIEQALIQKKENIREYLDTAWTIQLGRSLILFIMLYVSAPLVSSFFNAPLALDIIRAFSVVQLFTGATNIGIVYFQKELRFNKSFIFQTYGLTANMVISIILAFVLRSVWALVYGAILGAAVKCIASYLLHPYRPKIKIDTEKAKELLHFGKWIFVSGIVSFLAAQGDHAVVGKLLALTALGYYYMAYQFSNIPAKEIAQVISNVMYPVYSKIQDDTARLKRAYLRVLQLIAFLSMPITVVILVLAPDFSRLFLGEEWLPIVKSMRILTISGFFLTLTATTRVVFYAVGKPEITTFWQTLRLITLGITIFPLAMRWNIEGVSIAVCISMFIPAIGLTFGASRIMSFKLSEFAQSFGYPFVNTLLLTAGMLFMKWRLIPLNIFEFFMIGCFGLVIYLTATFICDRFTRFKTFSCIKMHHGKITFEDTS